MLFVLVMNYWYLKHTYKILNFSKSVSEIIIYLGILCTVCFSITMVFENKKIFIYFLIIKLYTKRQHLMQTTSIIVSMSRMQWFFLLESKFYLQLEFVICTILEKCQKIQLFHANHTILK